MDMSFLGGSFLGGEALGAERCAGDPFDAGAFGHDHVSAGDGLHGGVHEAAYIVPGDEVGDTSSPDSHLWMHQDGRVWDLGPADVDTDDDGIRDSLTRNGPTGVTVYTDTDHDGQVDRITEVDAQGMFSSRSLDPMSGSWVPTDSGRVG
ncbi:DUF6802 family protein [Gordonia sp. CPCC 206044]|uniref:DUF6802 family protein n=1 Tax=Gordonia sp. CPCC 206044 TaxID=3140793 RepID=UPI003AF39058